MSKHRAGRSAVAVPASDGVEGFRIRGVVPAMTPYVAPAVVESAPTVTFDAPAPANAGVHYVNTLAALPVVPAPVPAPRQRAPISSRLGRTVALGATLFAVVVAAVVVYL